MCEQEENRSDKGKLLTKVLHVDILWFVRNKIQLLLFKHFHLILGRVKLYYDVVFVHYEIKIQRLFLPRGLYFLIKKISQ